MSNDAIIAELNELLSRLCDGEPTAEEWQRIESLLIDNPNAQEHYRRFIALDVDLAWYAAENPSTASGLGESGERPQAYEKVERPWRHAEDGVGEIVGQCPWPTASDLQGDTMAIPPTTIPPIVIDPSPTLPSSVSSFVFSHIMAALILGIGLLIGLAWRISLPSSEPNTPGNVVDLAVGRITTQADCQWQKTRSGVRGSGSGISEIQLPTSQNHQIPVFLGDQFHLVSGLMEITYDTGAKVILEGPCTYEIESARGGYLAVGKLTAKVEKGPGSRGPGSGNANHSPLSPLPYPLFAVRTPTAIVTDLGTEFGVEVGKEGETTSHVFQGVVKVQPAEGGNKRWSSGIVLRHNESIKVEKDAKAGVARVKRGNAVGPLPKFVRRIQEAPRAINLLATLAGKVETLKQGRLSFHATLPEYVQDARYLFSMKKHNVLLDGVFPAIGGDDPVQLDSAGHTFDAFPRLSVRGSPEAQPPKMQAAGDAGMKRHCYWVFSKMHANGDVFGYLALHSNGGMTFDLSEIRRADPGISRLLSFVAFVQPLSACGPDDGKNRSADVWVFVDGQLKVKRLGLSRNDRPLHVGVKLHPNSRFLTLATTCGSQGPDEGDGIVFGNPVLYAPGEPAKQEKPLWKRNVKAGE